MLDILEMLVAWDAGEGISPIARRLGYTRATVRKYVGGGGRAGDRAWRGAAQRGGVGGAGAGGEAAGGPPARPRGGRGARWRSTTRTWSSGWGRCI